jgi:hypothetical protein
VVVEREVKGTNKATLWNAWSSLFKKGFDRADIVIALGKAWKRRNRR